MARGRATATARLAAEPCQPGCMDRAPRPAADWYHDPGNPAQLRYWNGTAWTPHTAPAPGAAPAMAQATAPPRPDANRVLLYCLLYGLGLGTVAGAASGTAAAPVLGTMLGAFVGALVGTPVALVAAVVVSRSVGTPQYAQRVDVTLLVLGIATALLAVGWISLRALVGPWPALTMLAVIVAGLIVVRPRLHRLGADPNAGAAEN